MDLSTLPFPWYVKAALLFAMVYPALGVLVARRRVASGQGSVVVLAILPMTLGAVVFWLGIFAGNEGIRMPWSVVTVSGSGQAAIPLFVACLSTCLVFAGTMPYRPGAEERPRSTLLARIVIWAPFVLAAAGFGYGLVIRQLPTPPGSLAGTVLGSALVALHLLATAFRVPPESRATAAIVFVSTVVLAAVTWQFIHIFKVQELGS